MLQIYLSYVISRALNLSLSSPSSQAPYWKLLPPLPGAAEGNTQAPWTRGPSHQDSVYTRPRSSLPSWSSLSYQSRLHPTSRGWFSANTSPKFKPDKQIITTKWSCPFSGRFGQSPTRAFGEGIAQWHDSQACPLQGCLWHPSHK